MSTASNALTVQIASPEWESFYGPYGSNAVGYSWTIGLYGNDYNMGFMLCGEWDLGFTGNYTYACTSNWGSTDGNGSWSQSGQFGSASIGNWLEWVYMNDGINAGMIEFSVN